MVYYRQGGGIRPEEIIGQKYQWAPSCPGSHELPHMHAVQLDQAAGPTTSAPFVAAQT
jgi:hypothetical protein